MADDDPFGILLSPPDDPNPYPHIRGDDRYFKTYDPFGTPMMNGSLPPAPPPSWRERRRVDYGRYMDRGGLFGAAWGMLPPEVRKSWATIPTLWAETTPGAGIRDTLDASGELTRAVMNADWRGALGGLGGMALGMVGSIPGGRAVTLPMDAASRMARADKMFPVEVFHGTAGDIRSFDPKRYGQTMPGPVSMTGGFGFARSACRQSLRGTGRSTTGRTHRASAGSGREAAESASGLQRDAVAA